LIRESLVLLGAYLIGSLSFATILVRVFRGVDVRKAGSQSAGATNVLRTAGKGLASLTLLLDVLKGTIAVLLMHVVSSDPRWASAAAVAVVIGHIFPVWFSFHGGKGVATAVGAFAVMAPLPLLVSLLAFLVVVSTTRFVSLGSLTAACLLPLTMRALFSAGDAQVIAAGVIAILLIFKHRGNIRRLVNGTERRLGQKEPPS
jgi:glycerol-3-phosphate acyltransferase PlsY